MIIQQATTKRKNAYTYALIPELNQIIRSKIANPFRNRTGQGSL